MKFKWRLTSAIPTSPKYVLFTDSKVEVYQPKIDQVTGYNTGKDRATVESFLVLGFGGSGQDMLKSFDVNYLGKRESGWHRHGKARS